MMEKIYKLLEKPYAVVWVMLLTPLLGFIDRNFVFFAGLGVVFLLLKRSKYDWSKFGLAEGFSAKTVLKALLISLLCFIVFSMLDPILEKYFGPFDLSSLEDIKGNLMGYVVLMIIMWIFAAFGEELLFRGYYMKGLAELLGNGNRAWILSAVMISVYFGVSHAYQGLSGVISVTIWSLFVSFIFNKNRNNLFLLVLVHGITDSIGITLLYLDRGNFISDWILQMI
ncbi:MAG: membrane protease YdiL (CAAX protease family) [Arcticibacterium sp.]|jgi:membrane protease YdiL (CAAX protease family)